MKSIVILISGRGSNMEAIINASRAEKWPGKIVAVISNRADAGGLAIASAAGIETVVLASKGQADREAYDQRLREVIDQYSPDLIVLAGFMRILTASFVQYYEGRMINIHPSLLPAFRGLNTHQRAIDAGVRIHGATVHYVSVEVDDGPIVAQAAVPVLPGDTEEVLAARVLDQEHRLYPQVVKWVLEGKVKLEGNKVHLASEISQPEQYALLKGW